jgi:taurine dioxygenase
MNVNSICPIRVVPSGATLGAEVRGVDLSRKLEPQEIERITEIWAEHLVLLFRDQELEDADLIRFAEQFGGIQPSGGRMRRWALGQKETGKMDSLDARVNYVSNLDKNGKPVMRNTYSGCYPLAWHSDNSYVDTPPIGTMLWADRIPDDGSGQTLFCNQIRAYEDLPEDVKALIDEKHTMQDNTRQLTNELRSHTKMPCSLDDIDGPVHPIVRIHSPSSRRALYLGRRASYPSTYIVEMPNDRGEEILDQLWAHATQEKYSWAHDWRRGDFLLWDNRAVMHRRTAINPEQPRVLHRVLIKGEPVKRDERGL